MILRSVRPTTGGRLSRRLTDFYWDSIREKNFIVSPATTRRTKRKKKDGTKELYRVRLKGAEIENESDDVCKIT